MTDDPHANWSARGRAPAADEAALRDRLDADDAAARREAALGLVDAATDGLDAATVDALAARVGDDPDADVRQFAVEALGNAGAAPERLRAATGDDDEWVRAEAVVALSRAEGEAATDPLRNRLDDPSGFVRRNALVALGKLGAADADLLRECLKTDGHASVREYAAEFLGHTPGTVAETVTVLAAVLARDPEALVRANAATSLGRLGTDRAVEALETQGIDDRSSDVQRAAKRAIADARGRDPDAVDVEVPSPAPPGGGDGEGPQFETGSTPRAVDRSPRSDRP
ncbi:HEAT repeat domain-containing protein [Haloplanus halophilus]|uniref:HEAT repeat domain-containing protein n=1 Tax=Haloplanus halophilus TaxID=2949993 RepID=UPI00203EAC25|nr:HEAT repeat domain-containing protein [Haloplanus sp. GDY1]